MRIVIFKLKNTIILIQLICLFFNICLTKSLYFSCGIIELSKEQDSILRNIYEKIILEKLGLSKKFLRKVLYIRKNTLRNELVTLITMVETLVLKLCIGQKRAKIRIS